MYVCRIPLKVKVGRGCSRVSHSLALTHISSNRSNAVDTGPVRPSNGVPVYLHSAVRKTRTRYLLNVNTADCAISRKLPKELILVQFLQSAVSSPPPLIKPPIQRSFKSSLLLRVHKFCPPFPAQKLTTAALQVSTVKTTVVIGKSNNLGRPAPFLGVNVSRTACRVDDLVASRRAFLPATATSWSAAAVPRPGPSSHHTRPHHRRCAVHRVASRSSWRRGRPRPASVQLGPRRRTLSRPGRHTQSAWAAPGFLS